MSTTHTPSLNKQNETPVLWIELANSMQIIQSFSKLSALPKSNMALASPAKLDLLSRLALSNVPLTPLMLSQKMGMKKSAISRLTTSLIQDGYIEKKVNPYDKRSHSLIVTQKGMEELNHNYRQMLSPVTCIYETLGTEDFHTLISLLEKANASLSLQKQHI